MSVISSQPSSSWNGDYDDDDDDLMVGFVDRSSFRRWEKNTIDEDENDVPLTPYISQTTPLQYEMNHDASSSSVNVNKSVSTTIRRLSSGSKSSSRGKYSDSYSNDSSELSKIKSLAPTLSEQSKRKIDSMSDDDRERGIDISIHSIDGDTNSKQSIHSQIYIGENDIGSQSQNTMHINSNDTTESCSDDSDLPNNNANEYVSNRNHDDGSIQHNHEIDERKGNNDDYSTHSSLDKIYQHENTNSNKIISSTTSEPSCYLGWDSASFVGWGSASNCSEDASIATSSQNQKKLHYNNNDDVESVQLQEDFPEFPRTKVLSTTHDINNSKPITVEEEFDSRRPWRKISIQEYKLQQVEQKSESDAGSVASSFRSNDSYNSISMKEDRSKRSSGTNSFSKSSSNYYSKTSSIFINKNQVPRTLSPPSSSHGSDTHSHDGSVDEIKSTSDISEVMAAKVALNQSQQYLAGTERAGVENPFHSVYNHTKSMTSRDDYLSPSTAVYRDAEYDDDDDDDEKFSSKYDKRIRNKTNVYTKNDDCDDSEDTSETDDQDSFHLGEGANCGLGESTSIDNFQDSPTFNKNNNNIQPKSRRGNRKLALNTFCENAEYNPVDDTDSELSSSKNKDANHDDERERRPSSRLEERRRFMSLAQAFLEEEGEDDDDFHDSERGRQQQFYQTKTNSNNTASTLTSSSRQLSSRRRRSSIDTVRSTLSNLDLNQKLKRYCPTIWRYKRGLSVAILITIIVGVVGFISLTMISKNNNGDVNNNVVISQEAPTKSPTLSPTVRFTMFPTRTDTYGQ